MQLLRRPSPTCAAARAGSCARAASTAARTPCAATGLVSMAVALEAVALEEALKHARGCEEVSGDLEGDAEKAGAVGAAAADGVVEESKHALAHPRVWI